MSRKHKNTPEQSENVVVESPVVEPEDVSQEPVVNVETESQEQPEPEQSENVETEQPESAPEPEVAPEPQPIPEIEPGTLLKAADGRGFHFLVQFRRSRTGNVMFSANCGRAYVFEREAEASELASVCGYCADGEFAPLDATDDRPVKARKSTKVEKTPEQLAAEAEQKEQERLAKINSALESLYNQLAVTEVSAPADTFVAILSSTIKELKGARASNGSGVAGPKAPRATYDVTPDRESDSPELAVIRQYANNGDERAQAIIGHVDAWVDADGNTVKTSDKLVGGVCSVCNSDKHIRRTGFFSAAREIVKMAERTSKVSEPETGEPEVEAEAA